MAADDALAYEVEMAARAKPGAAETARRLLAMAKDARTLRAYRRVFLNPDGQLTADACLVLEDLSREAGFGKAAPFGASAEWLNYREGARKLVLHVFVRLGRKKLDRLARRIRETQDE